MIKIDVNNNRTMKIEQDSERELITVLTKQDGKGERKEGISEGDFVMLINYYRHVKDNNIKCDFINPNGVNSL